MWSSERARSSAKLVTLNDPQGGLTPGGLASIPVAVAGDELRDAMRRAAAPVAVVTVDAGDLKYALTVGSLVSLSLEPALVGVSIGHASQSHTPLRDAGRFVASLLAGDQAALA